VLCD
jgi:hypothetical protein